MTNTNSHQKWSLIIGVAFLIAYSLPWFVLGEQAFFHIHDNLDSDVVWYRTLAESGKWFTFSNDTKVDQFMNGIPRNSLPATFSFVSFLFWLLPTFYAFLCNKILTHLVAFIGMRWLLKDFIFPKSNEAPIVTLVAICFAAIPFYGTHSGIAISGLPLIFWAFFHISKGTQKPLYWLVVVLFPFYSSLIYTGVFFLIILGVYTLVKMIRSKRIDFWSIGALATLTIGYIISEINLVIQTISGGFTPHRIEMAPEKYSFSMAFDMAKKMLLNGQYHAPTLHSPFIFYTVIVTLLLVVYLRVKQKAITVNQKALLSISLLVLAISIIQGLWNWDELYFLKENYPIFRVIQWNRFYWLLPFFWSLLFALSFRVILDWKHSKITYSFVIIIALTQLLKEFTLNTELGVNYGKLFHSEGSNNGDLNENNIGYNAFYATPLFQNIMDYIQEPPSNFRVASIGIYPEVATYNGFYSLDSYQRNYPIKYKHAFRKIIQNELNKSEVIQQYFDQWGSRCYILTAELEKEFLVSKEDPRTIQSLALDLNQFKKMGGRFIFSAVEIENYQALNLKFHREFNHPDSYWRIYLYEF